MQRVHADENPLISGTSVPCYKRPPYTESERPTASPVSPTNATYVEPSAETILKPGTKLSDLLRRNMTQAYVLQRLSKRAYWVQSFNYGTVFYVGERGVLIFDTLEGVYDNIAKAVASVTDKPISAAIYPHYHADHIGDIAKYVDAAKQRGVNLEIIAATKTKQSMDLAKSSFPRPTKELKWPHDSFQFEGLTVELHGFEWAAHCDDHSAWLLEQERIVHSPDLINPDQPPFWRLATSASASTKTTSGRCTASNGTTCPAATATSAPAPTWTSSSRSSPTSRPQSARPWAPTRSASS